MPTTASSIPIAPPETGTTAPLVSVIVPHYNDPVALDRCLAALIAQCVAGPVDIIVADNASPQGAAAIDRIVAGRARVVVATERGAGPARNAGVLVARGAILAFTDCDCLPDPGWLAAGVAALGDADVIGGRMVVLVPDHRLNAAQAFEAVFAFDNEHYVRRKQFTVSANLFCSRAVFGDVGPFGVGLSEDLDWGRRAVARGYRLAYAPGAIVGHPARDDWRALTHKWRRIQAETYGLQPPTWRHRLRWLGRSWLMPLSIVAHAPKIWRSAALTRREDRWAALRGLVGIRLWRLWDAHRLLFATTRS